MARAGRPRPRAVEVTAFAKLNLGLAVGPTRGDGFHDLATIFQSISLADTLVARPRRTGFTLRVRFEDASVNAARRRARRARQAPLPAGDENLVLRAARLVAEHFPNAGGAAFTLTKRIPIQAGLGGGSADAAATLVAMRALYGLRMPRAMRLQLAAQLGSDVPFAALGGTALGLGRGEQLTRLTLDRPFQAVIAMPAWRVATREAFRAIDRRKYGLTTWRTKSRLAHEIGREGVRLLNALRLGNTFERVLGERQSDFEHLRARLLAAGATRVHLTGSGSAVFGIPGPLASANEVVARFAGNESLFVIRSTRVGTRLRFVP